MAEADRALLIAALVTGCFIAGIIAGVAVVLAAFS